MQTSTQLIFPKMGYKGAYFGGKLTQRKGGHQGAALFASRLPKEYSKKEGKDWGEKRGIGSFLPWLSRK
jgi:hypothetical protein